MNFYKTTSIILALAVGATSAHAESPQYGQGGHGKEMSIVREDALARVAEKFDKADANSDGVLTGDEVKGFKKGGDKGKKGPNPEKLFEKLDVDKSSEISKVEMAKFGKGKDRDVDPDRLDKHFAKLDVDGSGGVSKDEFMKGMKDMKKHRKGGDKPERKKE